MNISKFLTRPQRALLRALVLCFGDRALLQIGLPGRLARALGCPPGIFRPHPYTLYELNPNWRSPFGRSQHNSAGFRGPESASDKPVGRFRIVCMGESSTYCTGIVDDDATYPARLAAHLSCIHPDRDVEVVNAGVGGYTSIENLLRLLFHVVPLSPDLIVYYYTHNDTHPRRLPKLSRDYREYSRSWYEPPFGGGVRGWVARRRALASAYIGNIVRSRMETEGLRRAQNVVDNAPLGFRANLSALTVVAQAAGAAVLFVSPPYRELANNQAGDASGDPAFRAVWEHREIVEDIANKFGAAVYDLAADMPYPSGGTSFPNEYYLDPVHFNENGADLAGRLVAGAIDARGLLEPPQRERLIV